MTSDDYTPCPDCEDAWRIYGVAGMKRGSCNWIRCECRRTANNEPRFKAGDRVTTDKGYKAIVLRYDAKYGYYDLDAVDEYDSSVINGFSWPEELLTPATAGNGATPEGD